MSDDDLVFVSYRVACPWKPAAILERANSIQEPNVYPAPAVPAASYFHRATPAERHKIRAIYPKSVMAPRHR